MIISTELKSLEWCQLKAAEPTNYSAKNLTYWKKAVIRWSGEAGAEKDLYVWEKSH